MAEAITWAVVVYGGVGLAFAGWFAFHAVNRFDPAAAGAGVGFRLLILPGAIALWPFLLWRLRSRP